MIIDKIFKRILYNNQSYIYIIISIIVTLSVFAVIIAIIIDFSKYNKKNNVLQKKITFVSTLTMTLFFITYYLLIKFKIGFFYIENNILKNFFLILGTIFIISGAYINIKSRIILSSNWSDYIQIYSDQNLITIGAFKYVRHPLYASLFLMFYGGSFAYSNWLSFTITTIVFIPMMNYRASQEEFYLEKNFDEYKEYKKYAGRFLPKTLKGYKGG